MKPTVIIGAGLSGLTAGYVLQTSGREVVILERSSEPGGLSRSLNLDGCIFDIGPHYFFLDFDRRVDRLVKECLGDGVKIFDFRVSAVIKGRNLAWPPDLSALRHLPLSSTLTTIKNALKRRFPPDKDCQGFMRAFYGSGIYESFIGPYLRKKVPILEPDRLHREWWLQVGRDIRNKYQEEAKDQVKKIEARRKVSLKVRAKVFYKLFMGLVQTAKGANLRKVLYPLGGMGRLAENLAVMFEGTGGKLVLGAGPVRLHRSENRIAAVSCNGKEYADPETVIWTGSIHGLTDQFGLDRYHLPFLKIVLGFARIGRRLELPPYLYTYYARPEVVFNRAYFPSLISTGLVPDGKDGICVEISPAAEQADKPLDEEVWRKTIIEGLDQASLCRPRDVESLDLLEVPEAYPVYPLDYYETLRTLWEELERLENLWSIGRSAQFYYNNMARSMALGLDLAEHLTGKGG
jgi:protoporphyrinogen oxidase